MKAAVIGAGEMGHGIAELFAISGFDVTLCDVKEEFLQKALGRIRESLERLHSRGKAGDVQEVLRRIAVSTSIAEAAAGADIVVEAVPENLQLKRGVFAEIEAAAGKEALLATNTSNIRIGEIAAVLSRKDRVVGMHFFNPPVVMKLVEIIRGEETSDSAVDSALKVAEALGKTAVLVKRDTPGFIVNRINAADLFYFGLLAQQGIDVAAVDAFMKGQGLPMGPFELMDFVGIDTVANSIDYFSKALSPDFAKCTVYGDMVRAGRLGRKSGQGFYRWEGGKAQIPKAEPTNAVPLLNVFAIEINEAAKLMEEGVATADDIENAVRLGMNRPFGPIAAAKGLSNSEIRKALEGLHSQFGVDVFSPSKYIREGRLSELLSRKEVAARTQKQPLLMEVKGGVAVLTINRQPMNTINAELLDALDASLRSIASNSEVRVVVVRAEGENFSAGAELSSFFSNGVDFMNHARKGERLFRYISEMPKTVIASIKGYVLGGGLELALACDIRICGQNARIGFPEVTRGLVPAWGGSERLPRLIGLSRATEMILTGKTISAQEAFSWGLVSAVVQDPDEEAMKIASELSKNVAPVASMLAKQLLNRGGEVPTDIGLEMEAMAAGVLFGTEDLREGIGAFLAKRKAEFKGR